MKSLYFDNQFTQQMPADPDVGSNRKQLKNALYARVNPTPVRAPELVHYSQDAALLLNLTEEDCSSEKFLHVFAGNNLLEGMDPHATCYGGHQFGNWAGQLGDGRAINLGEVSVSDHHLMLQLKGAGPTPFSRTADGLAVLRSSLREYLCSEAMFYLGIPTTRALSLITTGEEVVRDMLYDGNPAPEQGAVVCRLSSSFVRFGHFQMLAARQETELLEEFTNFVIRREFQHLNNLAVSPKASYIAWFEEICNRTADLMVHWMRVGFVHGVMNTDNMSIIGETIDYGPYGWLEGFDPNWTPNTTDAGQRRYRYGQQPAVGQWNLMQLANAILPLVEDPKPLEEALTEYVERYEAGYQKAMTTKLGLLNYDKDIVDRLINLLTLSETDMTLFFRALAQVNERIEEPFDALRHCYYSPDSLIDSDLKNLKNWIHDYLQVAQRQGQSHEQRQCLMNQTNPKYVLRNYLSQIAIDNAENGDYSKIDELLNALKKPYDEQPEYEHLAAKRPEWARDKAGCSMLSCSS
jgi:uncharacterized protein YdiU (UPF0061 family)